jgi:Ca2+-transporting ATPase
MMILWTRSGDFSVYDLTRFFTVFVMLQFWNMFNAKVFLTNRSAFTNIHKEFGFTIVVLLILLGQFLIVSFGGEVFRTVPLSLKDWLLIIASTSIILWIPELYRLIQRNK